MMLGVAPLHRATRVRAGGGIMPHPEAVEAQKGLNSLQIHRIWLHVLRAAPSRVLLLSAKKARHNHPLVWARDSVRLVHLMRDSVLLPHYLEPKEVRQRGCHNSVAVFLFHGLTGLRVLSQSRILRRGSPPPTSCTHGSENVGSTNLRGCVESICRRNHRFCFFDVAPFAAPELDPPFAVWFLLFNSVAIPDGMPNGIGLRLGSAL